MDEEMMAEVNKAHDLWYELMRRFVHRSHPLGRRSLEENRQAVSGMWNLEFDLDSYESNFLSSSLQSQLLVLLHYYRNGGPEERQAALVEAEKDRGELDSNLASPDMPADQRPMWRALRKGLDVFPPPSRPAGGNEPPIPERQSQDRVAFVDDKHIAIIVGDGPRKLYEVNEREAKFIEAICSAYPSRITGTEIKSRYPIISNVSEVHTQLKNRGINGLKIDSARWPNPGYRLIVDPPSIVV